MRVFELMADGHLMPPEKVGEWRDGSSFLPGAKHIVEMVDRLAAEGDSLDQIRSRIWREVDLIRRYENGPGLSLGIDAEVGA